MGISFSKPHGKTLVVVGGGIFGASTVLALSSKYPDWDITLVDPTEGPNPGCASHDKSKIVRDDYDEERYITLAMEAMRRWDAVPLYSKHFHKVGFLRAQPDDFSERSLAKRRELGLPTSAKWMSPEEVREAWPAFKDATFGGIDKVMFNPDYGFVEAEFALRDVREAAFRNGVKLVTGEVKTLLFDDAGNCTGAKLDDGRELRADSVLLCTGARTNSLLVDSAPERTDLHAGHRIRAAGAISFTVKIEDHQKDLFQDIPVFKNREEGVMGEFMSVIDGVAKFNCDAAWTNNDKHPVTGETMSVAPTQDKRTAWTPVDAANLPEEIKQRISNVKNGLFGGQLAGNEVQEVRFCWDAYTPSHDFTICEHPKSKNLYIATGGTFHGWKFFPVIGECIVKLLEGTIEKEYRDLWAWDRPGDAKPANTTYGLGRDLSEMK
ncbi:sarcosine oxidase [Colletotrichum musicola]|uniref:Sarcosine oxidase n=1 Tax=Colletotrichum musicola TaxID=2175873 RepID=A0A8H6K882_9PEZI|nr:sarcosine oxidase [Colletotrichum musicola]